MNTTQIKQLQVNEELYRLMAEKMTDSEITKSLEKLKMHFSTDLINEIEQMLKNEWIEFEGKQCRYNKKIVALLPDFKNFRFGEGVHWKCNFQANYMTFDGFKGEILTVPEFKKLFPKNTVNVLTANNTNFSYFKVLNNGSSNSMGIYDHDTYVSDEDYCLYIPIYRFNGVDSKLISTQVTIKLWIENNLVPRGLSPQVKEQYKQMRNLIRKKYIIFDQNDNCMVNIEKVTDLLEDLKNGSLRFRTNEKIIDYKHTFDEILSHRTLNIESNLNTEILDVIKESLLDCDWYRADMASYPDKVLVDPNAGHWELWKEENDVESVYTVNGEFDLVARNPIADIKKNGVVGIDFGTKSTVVTYLDNNQILPMRVGTGDLSKKVNQKHYENPTVMEFINLNKFLLDYSKKEGRPRTFWQDIVVSHTAADDMVNANSTEFNAFINDLKQWAGDEKRMITLLDKEGENRVLQPFHELDENEFNPIEIYAYYIGLYINNMWNGIYLDYMLSFPVTYDLSTRKKIANCFERGLKKSLPVTVLHSEEHISKFEN